MTAPEESTLSYICVDTGKDPIRSVIWLHGLGADGTDFEPLVPHIPLPKDLPTRFIFPHATVRPVTLNGGMPMRAWYDILSIEGDRNADQAGIQASAKQVAELIQMERDRGIAPENILLAGFSQGGAMALEVGLRYPEKLAGMLILSAYLLNEDKVAAQASEANRDINILQCHGEYDPVVPMPMAQKSSEILKALNYKLEFKLYPIDHSLHPHEVTDIGKWIVERLKA